MIEIENSPKSPATLFLELWEIARGWTSPQRTNAAKCAPILAREIQELLVMDSADFCYDGLSNLITISERASPIDYRGRVLHIMNAIDRLFLAVHPRSVKPLINSTRLPGWLIACRDHRRLFSHYAQFNELRLIARGPLRRSPRSELATFAENLSDRFTALSAVPKDRLDVEKHIGIIHKLIPANVGSGITGILSKGNETIAFFPIAEKKEDLIITGRVNSNSGQHYVDYRPHYKLEIASNFVNSIDSVIKSLAVDIAIAPELVIPEHCIPKLSENLKLLKNGRPRLVIAGSGVTDENEDGQPWNETSILNGYGKILWKHRKIWPAGINNIKCDRYGICREPADKLTLEDTAAGKEITVVDIDSIGRCIVLICQDIEQAPLIDDLMIKYQPDWIFCPILDEGLKKGSWAHRRAFSLSDKSHARFLMSTSTALADFSIKPASISYGLAIGPRDSSDPDSGRMVIEATPSATGVAIIQWRGVGWSKTTVE